VEVSGCSGGGVKVYDVVIVGAGSTGTSIAFYLASKGVKKVLLIDKSCLGCGQTSMSSAIIRTQYSHPEARAMAVYSWRFLRERFVEETGCEHPVFYEVGVAYGGGREHVEELRKVASALHDAGVEVRLMDPEDFSYHVYPIDVKGLELVSWEPHGGYGDPHTLVTCFTSAAQRMGVEVRLYTRVVGLDVDGRTVRGVRLEGGEVIAADYVVNAMNVWANEVLAKHGLELPITIGREEVVVFEHPGTPAGPVWADLVLGFYARREGAESTLVGGLEPAYPVEAKNLEPAAYTSPPTNLVASRGDVASKRFPHMVNAKPRAAWYGFYDITPDWQPILGPDHRVEGLIHAVGLSGHGFKLSPAIGDIVSDYIVRGKPRLVSPKTFSLERFTEGRSERGQFPYPILG
jgi:glycine/D-amino acid oxidase-like deaminating enzyme